MSAQTMALGRDCIKKKGAPNMSAQTFEVGECTKDKHAGSRMQESLKEGDHALHTWHANRGKSKDVAGIVVSFS
eukprot:1157349-Pelagomonas_calceolata.AAC.16